MFDKLHEMPGEPASRLPADPPTQRDPGPEWAPLVIPGLPLRAAGQHRAPKGQDFPLHYHRTLELVMHRAGHIVCRVLDSSGRERQLETFPGCIIVMPAGVVHGDVARSAYQHDYLQLEPLGFPQFNEVALYRDTPDHRLERLVTDLVVEWHGAQRGRETMVRLLLEQLLLTLEWVSLETVPDEAERRVRRFEGALEERYAENPSIRSLAGELGMGYSSLREQFSRRRGYSPKAFLKAVRVRRALELIGGSSLTLEEVASVSSFDSASHLWRDIKQATGQTPGDFRHPGMTQQGDVEK